MIAALAGAAVANGQDWDDPTLDGRMSCTSIMVGKKASTDGSVMTSHTCDGNYRTWVDIVPGQIYDKDTTVAVYTGRMHTDLSTGTRGMVKVGEKDLTKSERCGPRCVFLMIMLVYRPMCPAYQLLISRTPQTIWLQTTYMKSRKRWICGMAKVNSSSGKPMPEATTSMSRKPTV